MVKVVNRFSEHSPLDRPAIVRAARFVITTEGLRALTMRRLGRELGVEAMSLYHYIANKDELLQLVIDDALTPDGDDQAAGAIDALERFARRIRAAIQENPGFGPLIAERVPTAWLDHRSFAALHELLDEGFDEQAASWIIDAFIGSVLGLATMEASGTGRSPQDADASFETGLRLLVAGLSQELGG